MSSVKNAMQSIVYLRLLERQLSFQPPEQSDGVDLSETKQGGPCASKLTFVEDFILEHCAPGACISSIEISGSF
jgi:hypothetical protein